MKRTWWQKPSIEDRRELVKKVLVSAEWSYWTWIQFVFAVVVLATGVGVGQSALVVVGAVALPLLMPVVAVALGLSMGDARLITGSLRQVAVLLGLATVVSFMTMSFIRLQSVNVEVVWRMAVTVPLMVAVACSAVVVLAALMNKGSVVLAGVPMSLLLVAPLCVVSVGILLGDGRVSWGGLWVACVSLAVAVATLTMLFAALGLYVKETRE